MTVPELTVSLPSFGPAPDGGWRRVLDLAVAAEEAGVDRVLLTDHVVMGPNTDAYQWGRFPQPPDAPWLEPLTVLTAMAAVTSRVRLSTGILIAPLRPAALLAKTAATLDVLSQGRFDLGVGTGWQREEYEAEGLEFDKRGRLLTDTVAACRALWEQTPAAFESPSLSFEQIYCEPKPVQEPLPVWFSGVLHERNLRRVVELGDGWIPIMGASLDDIADGVTRLRAAYEAAGRDPATLQVQAPPFVVMSDSGGVDLDRTLASVPQLAEIGVTSISVFLRMLCADIADGPKAMADLVQRFPR